MFRRMTRDRFLSDHELARFMTAVRERRHKHQPRDHAFFALLANTGMRPSEALALTRGDCHLECHEPWIRLVRLKKKTKAQRFDDLVIPTHLATILRSYVVGLSDCDRLFKFTRRQTTRLFHNYRRACGLRKVKLYILRHTAATRLYRATRDIKVVQAILGHEKPDTSAIYAHISKDMQRELADSFPTIV